MQAHPPLIPQGRSTDTAQPPHLGVVLLDNGLCVGLAIVRLKGEDRVLYILSSGIISLWTTVPWFPS